MRSAQPCSGIAPYCLELDSLRISVLTDIQAEMEVAVGLDWEWPYRWLNEYDRERKGYFFK